MIKRTLLGAAAAVALLAAASTANAAQPFAEGWNHVMIQNCVFIPVDPTAAPTVPPAVDKVDIYLDVIPDVIPAPPPAPPPIIESGVIHTSDPVAMTLASPYCISGAAFFMYWDVTKQLPLFFSLAKAWE